MVAQDRVSCVTLTSLLFSSWFVLLGHKKLLHFCANCRLKSSLAKILPCPDFYVNECEKLKDAFVKAKEKELDLEKGRLKNSDNTVEVLSTAIDDLSVKKTSLYQEIAIPANHVLRLPS
ncbi:hypothetical protein BDF21DRAFT_450375 [Thamnidium elegans]|nr:hypothetical protein BDF21DRAFT_450375 [Thamnidium elegans]